MTYLQALIIPLYSSEYIFILLIHYCNLQSITVAQNQLLSNHGNDFMISNTHCLFYVYFTMDHLNHLKGVEVMLYNPYRHKLMTLSYFGCDKKNGSNVIK